MIDWWGPVIYEYYGATETGVVVWHDSAEALAKPGTVGRVVEGAVMRIVDEQGKDVRQGEVGEIFLRGPLFNDFTYNNDDAKRQEVALGDLVTVGDVGYQDADGYVFLCDRKRDMIISGGFNVFSTEVEERVLAHPAVQDCAVIGVPDEKWGEAVKAVVELKPGAEATSDELIAHCRAALGGIKTPKSVEIWETLPRSPVGKVLKRAIRERFWTGRDRAV